LVHEVNLRMPYDEYVVTHVHTHEGKGPMSLMLNHLDVKQGLVPPGFLPGPVCIASYVIGVDVYPSSYDQEKEVVVRSGGREEDVTLVNSLGNAATGLLVYDVAKDKLKSHHWSSSPLKVVLKITVAPEQKWKLAYEQVIRVRGLFPVERKIEEKPYILYHEDVSLLIGQQMTRRCLSALACTSKKNRDWVKCQLTQRMCPVKHELQGHQALMYEYYEYLILGKVKCDGKMCRPSSVTKVVCILHDTPDKRVNLVREVQSILTLLNDAESWWDFDDMQPFNNEEQGMHESWIGMKELSYVEFLHVTMCQLRSSNYHEWSGPKYDFRALRYAMDVREKRLRNIAIFEQAFGKVDTSLPFEDEKWFHAFMEYQLEQQEKNVVESGKLGRYDKI